ncbi:MAG: heme lyase NrfEFG subunit NrfE, partial [Rhodospirillales bacterium]|nr:heme lyase NrfEFG subunit NrfE [Rhodospirillales bacterium]
VLLGTLYPLFLDVLELGKVSVGAPYFNGVFVPMMIPAIMLMGVAPLLKWKRGDGLGALLRLKYIALIGALAGLAVWLFIDRTSALAALGMGLAAWLLAATIFEFTARIGLFQGPLAETWRRLLHQPRASWGMTLAHGGLALMIAGMTASSTWQSESIQVMQPGSTVNVGGYAFKLVDVRQVPGPNYVAMRGQFDVTSSGGSTFTMFPEKRAYGMGRPATTEAAIRSTFLGDLYAVVSDPDATGGYVTRLYFNPLVPWMWTGALIMVLGAGISLTDRRYRIGAPAKRAQPAGAAGAEI